MKCQSNVQTLKKGLLLQREILMQVLHRPDPKKVPVQRNYQPIAEASTPFAKIQEKNYTQILYSLWTELCRLVPIALLLLQLELLNVVVVYYSCLVTRNYCYWWLSYSVVYRTMNELLLIWINVYFYYCLKVTFLWRAVLGKMTHMCIGPERGSIQELKGVTQHMKHENYQLNFSLAEMEFREFHPKTIFDISRVIRHNPVKWHLVFTEEFPVCGKKDITWASSPRVLTVGTDYSNSIRGKAKI